MGQGSGQPGLFCRARLHKRRFNVEEDERVTQICTLDRVPGDFDDNSLDGVPVI